MDTELRFTTVGRGARRGGRTGNFRKIHAEDSRLGELLVDDEAENRRRNYAEDGKNKKRRTVQNPVPWRKATLKEMIREGSQVRAAAQRERRN